MPLFSHLRSPVPAVASSSTYLSFPAPPLSLSPARTFSAAPSPRAAAVVVAPPPTAPTASASHAVVPELASIPSTVGSLRPRRPASTFTGGLIGLLLGVSLASLYASARLLNDYQKASSLLLASVQELEDATLQMSNHVRRVEEVEARLERVKGDGAQKEDLKKLRADSKKSYDQLRLEVLDLKSHVWALEASGKSDTFNI